MPRATVPALGGVLLVGVTVLLAVALTAAVAGFGPAEPADRVVLEVTADAATGRVAIEHAGGPALDVREVAVRLEVDGEPLAHQPPVPFYAAGGYNGFPTGPFNPASAPTWSVGETAGFRVAGTNEPGLAPGATLTVSVIRDGQVVGRGSTTVV